MLAFRRIKSQNFYVSYIREGEILKSYNTIVGYIDYKTQTLYRVRYTKTTGKQISQYAYNNRDIVSKEVYVDKMGLYNHILDCTELSINTNYNEAHKN